MKHFDLLQGEYRCIIARHASDILVGHVEHVERDPAGWERSVEVAWLSAHDDLGTELTVRHWCVRLFLDADVRYDSRTSTTEIVSGLEEGSGDDAELERLIALRDSDLPSCHPDLPRAVGAALIEHGFCTEPVALHLFHASQDLDTEITFGAVYDE